MRNSILYAYLVAILILVVASIGMWAAKNQWSTIATLGGLFAFVFAYAQVAVRALAYQRIDRFINGKRVNK